MDKKKFKTGFVVGIILGALVAAAALYYYDQQYRKSDLEKAMDNIEKKATKDFDKAAKEVDKLFEE